MFLDMPFIAELNVIPSHRQGKRKQNSYADDILYTRYLHRNTFKIIRLVGYFFNLSYFLRFEYKCGIKKT